jgi:hypothetical protein
MFWVDLSAANLVDGGFHTASSTVVPGADITAIGTYLPSAKIGKGNYVYVYSGSGDSLYPSSAIFPSGTSNIAAFGSGSAKNAYGVSAVTRITAPAGDCDIVSNTSISVQQAYNIDQKIDDALPLSGNVKGVYVSGDIPLVCLVGCDVVPGTSTTCWDNNGNAANAMHYSTQINGGNGTNCGLSFVFH